MSEIAYLKNPARLYIVGNPRRKYPRGKAKIRKVMREFSAGTLTTGRTGQPVTELSQARAIALDEQRRLEHMATKRRKNKRRRRMTAAQRKFFGKRSNPRRRHRRHRRNPVALANPRRHRRHRSNAVSYRRRHHRRNAPNLRGLLEPVMYGAVGFIAPPYIRRFAAKYFPQLTTQSPYITALIDGGIGYLLSIAGEKVIGARNAGNMMLGTGILVATEGINALAPGTATLGNIPYAFPTSVASPNMGLYPKRIGLGARPDLAPSQFNISASNRYKRY